LIESDTHQPERDAAIEATRRTHWISQALSGKKRERLAEASRAPGLPAGDAPLSRRVTAKSTTCEVSFSRSRRRCERQGLLVEPLASAVVQRDLEAQRPRVVISFRGLPCLTARMHNASIDAAPLRKVKSRVEHLALPVRKISNRNFNRIIVRSFVLNGAPGRADRLVHESLFGRITTNQPSGSKGRSEKNQ